MTSKKDVTPESASYSSNIPRPRPFREIRAIYDETTITVYQAYSLEIANAAVAAQTFTSPPFKLERMTWVKPSFLWMCYRCGYATKDKRQERVLAIRIDREGFEEALACSSLSHAKVTNNNKEGMTVSGRVQWDPERTLDHSALPWRSLQLGLGPILVEKYVKEWIQGVDDVTELVKEVGKAVQEKRWEDAKKMLPDEKPYPLNEQLVQHLAASSTSAEE